MKQPLFRVSADTTAIVRLLMTAEIGDTVSWKTLSNELGRDANPKGPGYPSTLAARRILERDSQIAFETVPTEGLRRLNNIEIVESGDKFIHRSGRIVKRGVIRLACVDYASLPRDKQVAHNAKMSALACIAELGSHKSLRRIEQVVADADHALPAALAAIAGLGNIK